MEHAINFVNKNEELQEAITFVTEKPFIPFVDTWIPEDNQIYFRSNKDFILLSLSSLLNVNDLSFDIFKMSSKRSYNSDEMRTHTVHYLNYFLNYFDRDKELITIYSIIKYFIDYEPLYTKEMFFNDLNRYILSPSIIWKFDLMNMHNYSINLSCNSKIKESLKYDNTHGKLMMKISLLFNAMIPLISHFMGCNNIVGIDDFILEVYDILLYRFDDEVDIYSKIYETSITTTNRSAKQHAGLWDKQEIRSRNVTTHAIDCVNNILLNIIPKYIYSKNAVIFNYQSLLQTNRYKIEDISYEFAFFSMSSSKRDEDHQSEFDKFESYQIRKDESLHLQNKMNAKTTVTKIDFLYGPFPDDEIQYYKKTIGEINDFQKELVFNMFYKFFGDTDSIKDNNKDIYYKLIIAAKRLLLSAGLRIMPYIISAKIDKMVRRKNINKKELTKILESPLWEYIKDKYRSEKIEMYIMNIIATILSSKFTIVDYENEDIDGMPIEIIPAIVCEEVLIYISQI